MDGGSWLTEYLRACRNMTSSSGRGSLYLATSTIIATAIATNAIINMAISANTSSQLQCQPSPH